MNLPRPSRHGSHHPASTADVSLDHLRKGIDSIDDRIVSLLDERARLARQVARVKAGENRPVHDPERERKVLDRLATQAESFPGESVRAVYREVIRACRTIQLEAPVIAHVAPANNTVAHVVGPSHVRELKGGYDKTGDR